MNTGDNNGLPFGEIEIESITEESHKVGEGGAGLRATYKVNYYYLRGVIEERTIRFSGKRPATEPSGERTYELASLPLLVLIKSDDCSKVHPCLIPGIGLSSRDGSRDHDEYPGNKFSREAHTLTRVTHIFL